MNSKPQPLCQTISRDQVTEIVHHFYNKVLADAALAPHFAAIKDWPQHEGYIADFWWGVMGGTVVKPRPGAMIKGHQNLPLTTDLMQRWLQLFNESLDEFLPGDEAKQWQAMARGIATMMGEHGLVEKEE